MDQIINSILKLSKYIESESYRGYDPYDALLSPILQFPILKRNKTLRFGIQQIVKRSPVNFRTIMSIPKGYNPVTLGLCIQAYNNMISLFPDRKAELESKIRFLISELKLMRSEGFRGACWGYDFPWQAKYAEIPSFKPTVVATSIITNSLYRFFIESHDQFTLELLNGAVEFVLKDLKRSYDGNSFCFSYSPYDSQKVYNASAKGIRILSQAYSLTNDERLKEIAKNAVNYIIERQRSDGSWVYSERGTWIDNYHSGYILDCLDEYRVCTSDNSIDTFINKGFEFYKKNLITESGIPKFSPQKMYPIDCTSASQSILTLNRFQERNLAYKVAKWMINNMQAPEGFFYYRRNNFVTNKTSFMRWSNAWMFAGLSSFAQEFTALP